MTTDTPSASTHAAAESAAAGTAPRTEPAIRFLAGTLVLTGLALGHWVDPRWLLLSAFVGVNLVQSSLTGFCPAEVILRGLARGGCPIVCAVAKRITRPAARS